MPVQKLSILGSTGSIGTQALSLVETLGIEITSISGNKNRNLLEQQALKYKPKYLCAVDKDAAEHLKISLAHTDTKVLSGGDGMAEMMRIDDSDTVLTSVVGVAGLLPTIAAIEAGKNLALANKETLVAAGQFVIDLAKKHEVNILPVDSEHSAIFQCLQDPHSAKRLLRILLTASGGPFFGKTRDELSDATLEQTLKHPNWVMGSKITVDSATLMNKGLEVIEAMWLFGVELADIEVVVHRQSVVHSMVEFCDGSVLAQMGVPDMRVPIHYALTYPDRAPNHAEKLDFHSMASLTFERADQETFECLSACRKAAAAGGTAPCVANAANEQAVGMFLQKEIGFLDIGRAVANAVGSGTFARDYTIEELLETDSETRRKTKEFLQK